MTVTEPSCRSLLSIRYATDTTNMPVWTMHNIVRYVWVATDGPVIMFEFSDGELLDAHSEVIDEIRPATSLQPFYTGDRIGEVASRWADEIVELVDASSRSGSRRVAIDDLSLDGLRALEARGVELVSGSPARGGRSLGRGPRRDPGDEVRSGLL